MCSHFEKMHYITRTFLICPTKASNDVFQNLKTLDEQRDVCDDERKGHTSFNNIMREVKKDWAKYEADLLYQKVYNKYGRDQRPMLTYWRAGIMLSLSLLTDLLIC